MASDSFIRWIKGRASQEEQEWWTNWLHQDPGHKNLVEQAEELIQVTSPGDLTAPDSEVELRRFEASLANSELDSKTIPKTTIAAITRKPVHSWGKIAAACIVLLVTSMVFFLTFEGDPVKNTEVAAISSKHEFQTGFGEKISLKLSDGSNIVLNANSHLQYTSTVQEGQNIDVWLEGEAYFDITHFEEEHSRLFRVHTGDGIVEVLGTTFTVRTTSDGTQAVLEEGKIRLRVNDTEPDSDLIMSPGELARFSSGNNQVGIQSVNTQLYTSWIQNIWTFSNTPLADIAERMERTFGINVQISSETLRDKVFSGSIKSTNLEILKEGLSRLLDEPVTQEGNAIVIGSED